MATPANSVQTHNGVLPRSEVLIVYPGSCGDPYGFENNSLP